MAANSEFSPSIDEERWVSLGTRALQSELILEIDGFSPTIFQVPKSLSETKPEAYTPLLLGMGPYHHLRPDLHAANLQKLVAVNKFLGKNPSMNFSEHILKKMRDLELLVRASYDQYLDLECSTLDYILALDSFYLLAFLAMYGKETETVEPGCQELAKDILKLENQIPERVVEEMGKYLGISVLTLHSELFYYFCKAHSPLKLERGQVDRNYKGSHLLAHMYNRVINRGRARSQPLSAFRITEVGTKALKALSEVLGAGASNWINPMLLALEALQVLEISSKLADEITKIKLSKPPKKSHEIPSASELSKKHLVDFKLLEWEGIRDIKFDIQCTKKIYLPEITLKYDSEVVLRNLVAYESAIATPESAFELDGYIHLMSNLLQTPDDVVMLRVKDIITGDLTDGEVLEIFNGIGKIVGNSKPKKECASRDVVKKVKQMVEEWEKKRKRYVLKRVWKCVEKKVDNGVKLMRKPVGTGMKCLVYLIMIMLLVLEMLQAYRQIYEPNKGRGS
ncbi:unnamed protein product [Cuscuta epithymum]|uniref:Uncharacterized protein n=1 Tax=Cuscuta epithymum TaxID=186058 RepID=A0AAV0F2V9_9ASTE|nr:unnamed protein product [Cuscuta epithymum]